MPCRKSRACGWNFALGRRPPRPAELAATDIGISWLCDDLWGQGKCGLKVLQYMAAGLPVVANSVGVHRKMIVHGQSGFLADTPEEWAEAVSLLAENPSLRHRMGTAARQTCRNRLQCPSLGSEGRQAVAAIGRQAVAESPAFGTSNATMQRDGRPRSCRNAHPSAVSNRGGSVAYDAISSYNLNLWTRRRSLAILYSARLARKANRSPEKGLCRSWPLKASISAISAIPTRRPWSPSGGAARGNRD